MISLGKIGTPRSRSRWETALLLKVTKIFLQNGKSTSALFSTMIMVKSHLICHNQLLRTCQSTITHLHLRRLWKPFAKWRRTRQQDLTVLLPQKLFRVAVMQWQMLSIASVLKCTQIWHHLTSGSPALLSLYPRRVTWALWPTIGNFSVVNSS